MVALPATFSPTIAKIDANYQWSEKRDLYPYIRGSALGKCERHQWYLFRWSHLPEQFEGRMLRLFETGHREEARTPQRLLAGYMGRMAGMSGGPYMLQSGPDGKYMIYQESGGVRKYVQDASAPPDQARPFILDLKGVADRVLPKF